MTELRTTWRRLLQSPAHVGTVVVSLGIGMAICGAMFSALNVLIFSDAPGVVDRNSLARIRWAGESASFTAAEFDALAAGVGGDIDGLSAQGERLVPIVLRGEAASARAAFVSPALFETLGARPLRGRLLTRADGQPGAEPVTVIAEALWRRAFDGDPRVIGRALTIRGRPMVVVGVAPQGFRGLRFDMDESPENAPEVWLPLDRDAPHAQWLSVVARLRPGQAPRDVQARMAVVAERLDRISPPARHPAHLQVFRAGLDWRRSTWDSLLTTGLFLMVPLAVLGIACANVVNLQLARAAERTRELSVRLTLGASRWRVIRLLALEVAVLGLAAAAVGGLGAGLLLALASRLVGLALFLDTSIVAFFAVLVVAVVGAAGLAPGWMASRDLVAAGLRVAPGSLVLTRLRSALVVFQLTVSVVLVFVATLGVQTLRASTPTLPADAASILVAEIDLSEASSGPIHPKPFVDIALAALGESDAIRAAGAATFDRYGAPLRYWLEGATGTEARTASVGLVTAGWFEATDTRVLAGHGFADDERSAVVINESFAKVLGDRSSILGRRLRVSIAGGSPRAVTVTGIVADATPAAPPTAYLAMASDVPPFVVLTARARDAVSGRDAVRAALRAADPSVPRDRVMTLDRKSGDALLVFERSVSLLAVVAVLALVLAAVGLFALLSFTMRRRTREIGIRVALGASRTDVVAMVVRQAMTASVPTAWRALRVEPAVTLRDE